MRFAFTALLPVVLSVLAVAAAEAQIPKLLNYQATLTDTAGHSLPDGNYVLTFSIYAGASGGTPAWTETRPSVSLVDGVCSVVLGQQTPLALDFDRPYWLGVAVGGDPETTPRARLTAVPYALNARGLELPFTGTSSSPAATLQVENRGAGPALVSGGRLEIGTGDVDGELRLYRNGVATRVFRAGTLARGGYANWSDEAGHVVASLEADATGTGGYLEVLRDTASAGFVVNGNGGSEDPVVTIAGRSRSTVFNMQLSGTDAVDLPNSSVAADEVLDEPGVASFAGGPETFMDATGVWILAYRTIVVPADGYVIVTGMATAKMTHGPYESGPTEVEFGVSTSYTSLLPDAKTRLYFNESLPQGEHSLPVNTQGVFPVAAGSNTFYFLARLYGYGPYPDNDFNTMYARDVQMSLLYVPTAYGTVSDPAAPAARPARPAAARAGAVHEAELAAERAESRAAVDARVRAELSRVQAKLESLQRELASARAERGGR